MGSERCFRLRVVARLLSPSLSSFRRHTISGYLNGSPRLTRPLQAPVGNFFISAEMGLWCCCPRKVNGWTNTAGDTQVDTAVDMGTAASKGVWRGNVADLNRAGAFLVQSRNWFPNPDFHYSSGELCRFIWMVR